MGSLGTNCEAVAGADNNYAHTRIYSSVFSRDGESGGT
jgi:hypothetical protein